MFLDSIRKLRKRLKKYYTYAIHYPRIYNKYAKNKIDENKVLFIEPKDLFSNNFQYLYDQLAQYSTYEIHIHLLREFFVPDSEYQKRCEALLKDLATAKYVFIDEACNVFGRVHIREETQIAQVWHACGAFKKFGFSTADLKFGTTRKEMENYPNYKKDTFVTVSSPEVEWAYSEAMGLPQDKILPIGVSRTDVFFNNSFIDAARKKLALYMPSSKGRKVILYAPTFRGRIAKAVTAKAFSIERFYEALSDDYVLLIKHHPFVQNPPPVPRPYQEFAADFTKVMTIDELLCVADICISDYSSLVFEYSLFERPMLFFNYDIDQYFDWRGFYYDYDEMTPGPAFQTNREMIDYIQHIDERFDKQRVIDFKEKFMSACDGHSTERLIEKVFGDAFERHRKDPSDSKQNAVQIHGAEYRYSIKKWKHMDEVPQQEEIRKRLLDAHPESEGKTIVAYFPVNREQKIPCVNPGLDWQMLYEDLDSQYVMIYRNDGKLLGKFLPKKYQSKRFIDVNDIFSDKEAARVADIVVTDYQFGAGSDCLSEKPTLFYLPDYKWYCVDAQDYEESTAYFRKNQLLYENTKDLLEAIMVQRPVAESPKKAIKAYRRICEHLT